MDPFGIILFVEKEFEEEENEGGQEGDEKGTPGVKWGGHVTPLVLYHGWIATSWAIETSILLAVFNPLASMGCYPA